MGQKRPAPQGLPCEGPRERRNAGTGNQPALHAAPPRKPSQGNHGGSTQLGSALVLAAAGHEVIMAGRDEAKACAFRGGDTALVPALVDRVAIATA